MFILVHSKSRATSSLLRNPLRKSTKQSQLDHLHHNQESDLEHPKTHTLLGQCTALVVGCDDVASCYSVGVLTRRQVDSWEGSREARVVADS